MFEKFKDMGKMLKQANEMREKMGEIQKKLKSTIITAEALDGRIKVEINGEMDVLSVKLDPVVLDPKAADKLAKTLRAVFNDAIGKAKTQAATMLSEVTNGMDLPQIEN